MLTKDRYQDEKEEEYRGYLESLLSEVFEQSKRSVFVVSDDYYEDGVNRKYQICNIADGLGILNDACQKYGVTYEYKDYPYNHETHSFRRSMYIFKRLEKQKELVRTNSPYPKYQHK